MRLVLCAVVISSCVITYQLTFRASWTTIASSTTRTLEWNGDTINDMERTVLCCGMEIVCMELGTAAVVAYSLVPRPLPQLLSLAVRKSRRRPGRVSHVMRAAAYVTDSVNTYSRYSTCYRLFQRRYKDQTNSRAEAGPTYTTYLDLKQNR